MGGHQVTSHGSGDDGYDEDGYDESQRAEILEATRDGPSDGTIITDLEPDLDEDDDEAAEDGLSMTDGDVGEVDGTVVQDEEDLSEDDLQEDFDDETVADDDLDDRDDASLRP